MTKKNEFIPTSKPRRKWLMTDGSIQEEPLIEQSPSGRRVRAVGTKQSYPAKLHEAMAANSLTTISGNKVFALLDSHEPWSKGEAKAHYPFVEKGKFEQGMVEYTSLLRCVEHPELFLGRTLTASFYHGWGATPRGSVRLSHWGSKLARDVQHTQDCDPVLHLEDMSDRLNRFSIAGRNDLPKDGEVTNTSSTRETMAVIYSVLRKWREEEETLVEIPNLATSEGTWRFETISTDVTPDLLDGIAAVIEGAEDIKEAARLYKELRKVLSRSGLFLPLKREGSFARLISGDAEGMPVAIRNNDEGHSAPGHNRAGLGDGSYNRAGLGDGSHELWVDLLTGDVSIHCGPADTRDVITTRIASEAWEEARAIASITGQEQDLVNLAHEIGKHKAQMFHESRHPKP